jgi:prepilin peptidase CpaA
MHTVAWWPTVGVLAIATFTDLRSRRIPNWLVLPFLALGLGVSVWLHGWSGLWQSLGGIAVGGLIFLVLALMGGMGMGDVKLCAAIGAWIGPSQMFFALLLTAMAGGLIALGWVAVKAFLNWKRQGFHRADGPVLPKLLAHKIPYAPAIAIGTLISFFSR